MALFSNPRTMEWANVFRRQVRLTNGRLYRVYHPMFGRRSGRHQYKLNPFGAVSFALVSCVPFSPSEGRFHAVSGPSNAGAGKHWRIETGIAQRGQELAELKRRLERYGPRQQERGYMYR